MNMISGQNKRILIRYAYDGTEFHGSALQGDKRTVEFVINSAIAKLTGEVTEVISASRTDAGVHAKDNIAVFDTYSSIPAERFSYALNSLLPEDVRVISSVEAALDFHPRKVPTIKTYSYNLYCGRAENPLKSRYSTYCSYELDIEAMNRACKHILGEHDFSSFCAAGSTAVTKVRTVYDCRVIEFLSKPLYEVDAEKMHIRTNYSEGSDSTGASKKSSLRSFVSGIPNDDSGSTIGSSPFLRDGETEIKIIVAGSGFLYNMVRIIAGTLINVGRGHTEPEFVKDMIESRDRSLAGPTAPAKGLILESYSFSNP